MEKESISGTRDIGTKDSGVKDLCMAKESSDRDMTRLRDYGRMAERLNDGLSQDVFFIYKREIQKLKRRMMLFF